MAASHDPSIQQQEAAGHDHFRLAALLALLLVAAVAYGNSFAGPFVLDDVLGILDNPTLRSLWPPSAVLTPIPGGLTVSGRPILNLSLAFSHALSGTQVWGYHAVNLAVHWLAALLLYGIVRRTLEARAHAAPAALAALAAALWLAHPLQTESVTYMIQRAESLMGLLYLGTLYAVIRGAGSRRPGGWYSVGVIVCALGMGTKEVMVTAPVMVLFYDRAFLAGSFREAWRLRRVLYLLLASTWLLLAWLLLRTGDRDSSYGFGIGVPWWSHAAMQFEAVTRYLRLSLWPRPQVFDYGVIRPRDFMHVLPYALFVLTLLAATLRGVIRNRPWAFPALWFFVVLAPSSSIVPSARQTFSEHRMYLPLAALCVGAVLALYALLGRQLRLTLLLGVLWVAVFCLLSAQRNLDYRSDLALYASVLSEYPGNGYGHFIYANGLLDRGRDAEALTHLDLAVQLEPGDKAIHVNRAYTLLRLKRANEAIGEYEAGFRLGPVSADTFLGYAAALVAGGRTGEGLRYFSDYAAARTRDAAAQFTVGQLLLEADRAADAISYLESAQALAPGSPEIAALLTEARRRLRER